MASVRMLVLDSKGNTVEKSEGIKKKGPSTGSGWWEYAPTAEGKVVVEGRDLAGNLVRAELRESRDWNIFRLVVGGGGRAEQQLLQERVEEDIVRVDACLVTYAQERLQIFSVDSPQRGPEKRNLYSTQIASKESQGEFYGRS